MKTRVAALIAVLAPVGLGGCATVINGTSVDYKMTSEPSGARMDLSTGSSCVAPCKMSLKRRHDIRIDVSKAGYKPTYVLVQSKTGGAVVGNLLLGGLVGGVVDSANGSTNILSPRPLKVQLAAVGSSDEAVLLNKKGKVISTVEVHNDKVRLDVSKTIGAEAAGLTPAKATDSLPAGTASAPAPEPVPAAPPAAAATAPAAATSPAARGT